MKLMTSMNLKSRKNLMTSMKIVPILLFLFLVCINLFAQKDSARNPIIKGWYADPEITRFNGKYFIYPTYSAKYEEQVFMDAFSSDDLLTWKKHSRIIDTAAVKWANKAMWAPAIISKDGKYYLFFSANDVHEGEIGGIGVGVSDSPEGPFKDLLGKPLINEIKNGAQPIDQYVFKARDGEYYMIYGGWGHCNIVKLKNDFSGLVPFEDGTIYREITPKGYVEGPIIFERKGKYYFMWSEGGWTGPDYRVAYAMSNSIFGPFERIGTVLQQDPEIARGAGHHSVVKMPTGDDWVIAYHRRPLDKKGANERVVCLEKMSFDEKGFINPVKITHEGIQSYPAKPVVETKAGKISGIKNIKGDVDIYKGIPFAEPPVGNLRWKAPQPKKAWKGIKVCEDFAASPMQGPPAPFSMWSSEYLIQQDPISEDCLYLNVWTSSKKQKRKKPVLVWIYGGGFMSGGTNVPIYDGEAMAKKDIVFVSVNYRVGIFGFYAHPELTKESGINASGNYGLMDQVAALKWVKDNIAAFGGDPANVTIAGQSAGSMSVNSLVASPLAKGLFNKAIAQSGANLTRSQPTLERAEKEGLNVMQKLGAKNLDELRNLDADKLMKVVSAVRGPIIDGYVLPQQVADIIASKKQNKIALLTGWNEDEGLMMGSVKKAEVYQKEFVSQYGEGLLKYYPASNDEEAAASQKNLSRDLIFGMQNYAWAMQESKQGNKVYVYRFTRKVPGYDQYAHFGAFHTGEVPYAYGNLNHVNRPWEAVDKQLEKTMLEYWVNFIKTGNPNRSGLPEWPAFKSTGTMIMDLGTAPSKKKLQDADALEMLHQKVLNK